jgi:hypothetical protein
MIAALMFAGLLSVQSTGDFWVVTEANDHEVSAVNVGFAFVPEGQDYLLTSVHTTHRRGTAATRWTTPAYTDEWLAFRCSDQTFVLRGSSTSSGVADPIRLSNPDGAFVSVATEPKRKKQAEAVCQPRANHTVGSRNLYGLLEAHGVHTGGPANPPRLAGPQPYPMTDADRRREAQTQSAGEVPGAIRPPRIGVNASYAHNPGGILIVGYAAAASGTWISEFYLMSGMREPGPDPVVFVRRALDSYEAQEQIRWADSRTCPGLISALLPANDLPLPTFILPLDQTSRTRAWDMGPSAPPSPDGPGPHTFWGPSRGPAGSTIEFSSFGGPWVDWARSLDRVLEPCWSDARPGMPERD